VSRIADVGYCATFFSKHKEYKLLSFEKRQHLLRKQHILIYLGSLGSLDICIMNNGYKILPLVCIFLQFFVTFLSYLFVGPVDARL
jgi:hypothetical protein